MLKIEFKTDGAAFCDPYTEEHNEYWEAVEIDRILANIALKIEEGQMFGKILDINGNLVGEWSR